MSVPLPTPSRTGVNTLRPLLFPRSKLFRSMSAAALARLLLALSALLFVPLEEARAAFPLSGTLDPTPPSTIQWSGTATGTGVATSPATNCREGLDCDTFVLTFGGATGDWTDKAARIRISWQLPGTDYDLYLLRETPEGVFILGQSTNRPTNLNDTHEELEFYPGFYGAGRYLVRVLYTAASFPDQYQGSATVVPINESSCKYPGLTVLTDVSGDSSDSQPSHDIQKLSIAEPYMVQASRLVFTLKMVNLNLLTPNTIWRIYFRTPNLAGTRYFVDMRTDALGAVTYKYGTGDDTTLGDADEGHYTPSTGALSITLSRSKIGNPSPNQTPAHQLVQIYAQVSAGGLTMDGSPDDFELSQASYTIAGNGTCTPGKIAFISNRDGNNEVYLMDANGANQTNLTNHPATEYFPAWSPDGTRLAFASSRAGDNDIFVMNADGTNVSNLSNFAGTDIDPAWSPDGLTIAFDAWRDHDLTPGTAQIYRMDANGHNQLRLTSNTGYDRFPSWSPDGRKIVFDSTRDGTFNQGIYVMNADGSNQVRLSPSPAIESFPAWSPDGSRIAFVSLRDGNREIYVMNADGTNARRLTFTSANESRPAWSSDGLTIAFSSDRDGNSEIYVMNADGSNQTRLTSNTASDSAPAWQPR